MRYFALHISYNIFSKKESKKTKFSYGKTPKLIIFILSFLVSMCKTCKKTQIGVIFGNKERNYESI